MAALATPLHTHVYAPGGQRSCPIYVKHLAHKHTKQNKLRVVWPAKTVRETERESTHCKVCSANAVLPPAAFGYVFF